MKNIGEALDALHIISHMFGSHSNPDSTEVLRKLRLLGYNDDASFHLLWYLIHIVYFELECVVNDAMNLLDQQGLDIESLLNISGSDFDSLISGVRDLYCMDEGIEVGGIKPSWKEHFKSRHRKSWVKILNKQSRSVPYFKKGL